jgi:hypothetical protein
MFAAEERGELPKGTAERWAKHTKNIKDLPEKKKNKDSDKKKKKKEKDANTYKYICCKIAQKLSKSLIKAAAGNNKSFFSNIFSGVGGGPLGNQLLDTITSRISGPVLSSESPKGSLTSTDDKKWMSRLPQHVQKAINDSNSFFEWMRTKGQEIQRLAYQRGEPPFNYPEYRNQWQKFINAVLVIIRHGFDMELAKYRDKTEVKRNEQG